MSDPDIPAGKEPRASFFSTELFASLAVSAVYLAVLALIFFSCVI